MSDIIITNGLPADSPWILANTDTSRLDEANLINLAVGQLALLGASQGATLQIQTGKLKELVGSVDKVNAQLDLLSSVNSTPSSWSGNPADIGFPPESIGWKVPASTSLTANDIALVDKMITATSKIFDTNSLYLNEFDVVKFKYSLNINGIDQFYVSSPIIGGRFELFSPDPPTIDSVIISDPNFVGPIENGQIFSFIRDTSGTGSYVYLSGNFLLISEPIENVSDYFVIPQSNNQLQNYQMLVSGNSAGKKSVEIAIESSNLLKSTVELAPNTLPQTDPPTDPPPSNAINMAIDPGTAFDMAKYTTENSTVLYAAYPPMKVKVIDSSVLVAANVGKVVLTDNNVSEYIYTDKYRVIQSVKISTTEPFFYKPTNDQIINWKGQYAEKIIVITQRSSDQQLFVNNLAQKYQYAFDAATYVLKAFTTMLNSAANNI